MNVRQVGFQGLSGSLLSCVFFGAVTSLATGQTTIFEKPLSSRIANYDIKVTLDDQKKHIDGNMILTWNNPSDDHVDELQFHLYANAFKNAKSTFLREWLRSRAASSDSAEPGKSPWTKGADDVWGWIRIEYMEVDGEDVTERIGFFQPDDDNTDDETVIRVPLANAIPPGESARIQLAFQSKIPKCKIRTGWWHDDFFMMVHWFPKIGVYEPPGVRFVPADAPRGRWNCHQFHLATEFYADFGVYDVEITLPEKYVVGTTGLILEQRSNGDGTKTVVAHAEDVHEFAWVADAQFREANDVWRNPDTGREVSIRLLYQPGHEGVVARYIESVKSTLDYVEHWLGPGTYPYPTITVVDHRAASGAEGMEYPTLFTGMASWWAEQLFGDGLRIVESTAIHEFLHQIWYGTVASNEFEEAWLDEGLVVYGEDRILSELFGESTSVINWWGASANLLGLHRAGYVMGSKTNDGSIAEPSFAHWHRAIGPGLAYDKASLMLKTLENHLGRERFDQIIRIYSERWRFRHPCRDDFIAVANQVSGENLDWFFDQVLEQSTSLDYAVAAIANVPLDALDEGLTEYELEAAVEGEDEKEDEDEEQDDEGKPHQSTVVFRRVGEVVFPMEILVEFSDGTIVRDTWDGQARVKTFQFTRPGKVIRAAIDPDRKVPLDVNLLNNSLHVEENKQIVNKYTLKGLFWMQSLLQFFSILG